MRCPKRGYRWRRKGSKCRSWGKPTLRGSAETAKEEKAVEEKTGKYEITKAKRVLRV